MLGRLAVCTQKSVATCGARAVKSSTGSRLAFTGPGAAIRLIVYCEKIRVFKAGMIAIEYVSME